MFQPVRGTRDLLPDLMRQYRTVMRKSLEIVECYGYEEIETPIFEFAPVFRHMGETSDVVTKETYTFKDRGEQELTLRPEGTAGVVRAIISNGLTQNTPLKYYYQGPMFRYERPQKGRYRQFYQIGAELLGVEQGLGDIEVIAMAQQILEVLKLDGQLTLELNTLGDAESRDRYRAALVEYLQDFKDRLCEDSQRRLVSNPLRILDSKDEGDIKIIKEAPLYRDHLNAASEDFFAEVLKGLERLGISYDLNYRIVRGLDYYCHTTFEFVSNALGAQGTVLAGGRYDGLVKQMGGPDMSGIGWAAGVDRLAMLSQLKSEPIRPVTLVPLGEAAEEKAMIMAYGLRQQRLKIDLAYSGSLTKRLKKANKQNSKLAVIFGDEELAAQLVTVRNLDSGAQQSIPMATLEAYLLKEQR